MEGMLLCELKISIHALRKESDPVMTNRALSGSLFQSTLSVRRATVRPTALDLQGEFQSTLSVRRATELVTGRDVLFSISIHALRKESDWSCSHKKLKPRNFNPRSP